jgi:Bacterial Ig-like domain (group 2)
MLLRVNAHRFAGVVVFAVAVSGCGEKSPSAPTNTPPPTPTVTGLSIGGNVERLRTRQTQALTATVTLSNGTTQAATSPGWSSSNATVASVSDGGVVTANNQGSATISVTSQGQTATVPVSVWQDYQGTWEGMYRIRVCTATGTLGGSAGWCTPDGFGTGQSLPIRLTLTQQNGSTVNGSIELGDVVGTVAGTVYDSRHFVGAGSASLAESGFIFSVNIGTLDLLASSTQLAGSFIWTVTVSGLSGQGYNELDLVDVVRTSSLTSRPATSRRGIDSLPSVFRGMRRLQ